MAKTASLKHNPLSNPRSRASKRQTSPGINVDKSLKELSPAREPTASLSTRTNTGSAGGGGIVKRKGKNQKSTKQKQRDAKRQDRAEAVMEKMAVKVGLKGKRERVIKERKGDWGVVNGGIESGVGEVVKRKGVNGGVVGEDGWQDVEGAEQEEGQMEEVESTVAPIRPEVNAAKTVTVTETEVVREEQAENEEDKIT